MRNTYISVNKFVIPGLLQFSVRLVFRLSHTPESHQITVEVNEPSMGDAAASKKIAIPSWQRNSNGISPQLETISSEGRNNGLESPPREALLDQASRFLQDESIRDAPMDRKIAFLESKGVHNDEIPKLLGVPRNPEATEGTTATAATATTKPESPTTEAFQLSNRNPEPSSPQHSTPTQASVGSRTGPPIITYPEFLLQAPKPPPLVTFQSVIYTLYGAVGLAASIYGASQYLVKPMLNALNSARHELAETTQQNLLKLNEKLGEKVSTIPPILSSIQSVAPGEEFKDIKGWEDTDSMASDPTELFHRDIATQTTPDLEHSVSTSTPSTTTDPADSQTPKKIMLEHLKRLQTISSHLNEFLTDGNEESAMYMTTRNRLSELQTYLNSLTYSSPSYLNSSLYGVYGDDSRDWIGGDSRLNQANREDDAISAFKAEIRSVKGTLLSAKNFPQSSGGFRAAGIPGMSPR
jgi:hypothetical protein